MPREMIEPDSLRTEVVEVLDAGGNPIVTLRCRRDQIHVFLLVAAAMHPDRALRFPSEQLAGEPATVMARDVIDYLHDPREAPSMVPTVIMAEWATSPVEDDAGDE